jgi:hypothetical protein
MIEVVVSPARIPVGVADLEIRLTNSGRGACLNIIFTIRLPVGIMRLRGQDRITVSKLSPGESVTSPFRVRADTAGCYQLTSPNFSYRDHTGQSRRENGFTAEIIVDPEPIPPREPKVTAGLQTAELPLADWSDLRGRVSDAGNCDVSEVFVCYSHNDVSWLDRLLVHLKPLERQGIIDVWSDRRLQLGDDWRKEIERALARARIALLLVSADFMASDFIQEAELPTLLAAAEQGGCRVIPILVQPSLFMQTPSLSRFQHGNPRSVTLSEMPRVQSERVLTDVARSLTSLLGANLQ